MRKSGAGVFALSLLLFASWGLAVDYRNAGVPRKAQDATVMVCVEYGDAPNVEVSWGSGMIVGHGLVVTNAHVVNEKVPARISVANHLFPRTPATVVAARYDSNEFKLTNVVAYIANALLAGTDVDDVEIPSRQTNNDMAILSFTPPAGVNLPTLSFTRDVVRGERVVAVGYPGKDTTHYQSGGQGYGADFDPSLLTPLTFSTGIVTGVIDDEPRIVTHNARCGSGNSGGPLVDSRGDVVGMQTWATVSGGSGEHMSMAVGSRNIVAFLESRGFGASVVGAAGAAYFSRPDGEGDIRPLVYGRIRAGDANFMALAGLLHFMGLRGFERNDEAAVHFLQQALQTNPNGANAHLYKAGLAAVLIQSPRFWRPELAESLLRSANNSDVVAEGTVHPDYRLLAFESALRMQGRASGFREDPDRSMQLSEKAMDGGFALPLALSGYHYYFGDTAYGRDHAKALRNAREAARNDIPEGLSLLAHLYYDSDAVRRGGENRRVARGLAEEAAARGDPWAFGLLANMCYDSDSGEERAKAREWAMRGARYGNRLAVYCLGRMAWDAFVANPGDFGELARAWACVELAERQGVRVALPYRGAVLRSAGDILGIVSFEDRQRIITEGRREQGVMTGRNG